MKKVGIASVVAVVLFIGLVATGNTVAAQGYHPYYAPPSCPAYYFYDPYWNACVPVHRHYRPRSNEERGINMFFEILRGIQEMQRYERYEQCRKSGRCR